MRNSQKFALINSLKHLERLIEFNFGYIRSDKRGDLKREKLKEIKNEIKTIVDFIEAEGE